MTFDEIIADLAKPETSGVAVFTARHFMAQHDTTEDQREKVSKALETMAVPKYPIGSSARPMPN